MKLAMLVVSIGAALVGCGDSSSGPGGAVANQRERMRRSEAELNLNRIGKSAKAHFAENAEYPRGTTGRTPSKSCCEGPDHKCPASLSDWTGGVWERLDFEVVEPSHFQYTYESADGRTFKATAIGDLDCDATEVVYVMEGRSEAGNPTTEVTLPTGRD